MQVRINFNSVLTTVTLIVVLFCGNYAIGQTTDGFKYSVNIPVPGNTWALDAPIGRGNDIVSENGMIKWGKDDGQIATYFYTESVGTINVAIRARCVGGKFILKTKFNESYKDIELSDNDYRIIELGAFVIEQAGYQSVVLECVGSDEGAFVQITDVLLGGAAVAENIYFVKDDFYWGRRGPSVHLRYDMPSGVDRVCWFYNELSIPEENDIVGSYFMANGFGEGYFGIQVNSKEERRILFSVWSPFVTDNPNEIPENQKIILLRKGPGVITGEFGNEGSGGQSFRRFMWKTDTTYRFLLKVMPTGNGETDYTAYFFAPEIGEWSLIASFRRPKTDTYLTRPNSFLENFIPEMGHFKRRATYSNQWICDTNGQWHELNKIKFTADATARKNARLDYAGGVVGRSFFLMNCGFFSGTTKIDTHFSRESTGSAPEIDFSKLP